MQNVLGTFSVEFILRDMHWFHNIQSSDKEESIGVKCNGTSAINGIRKQEMTPYFKTPLDD